MRENMDESTEATRARDTHAPDHEIHPGQELEFTKQSKLVVYLLMASAFVMFLNETILSVALPTIMEDLQITPSTGQWLTTAYLLTMAIVIPMSGWIIQRFGTRRVFFAAMTTFALGALVAALSPGFGMLLIGRIIQATGTGVISPLFLTTIMTLVPLSHRGRVMGNVTIVMSTAPAVGPLVGGLIVSVLDWRWLFWLVLPIAIAALSFGAAKLVNVSEAKRLPIDAASVVLSAFAFGSLVYGFSSLGEWVRGDGVIAPWIPLTVGAIALALFLTRQRALASHDAALLDIRVFAARGYAVAIGLLAMLMAILFGTVILLPIYLQSVLGLDPASTGLLLLPGGLLMGLAGPTVGRWYDRFGPRALLLPGTFVAAAALWSMALLLGASSSWVLVLACHLLLSVGLALIFTPLFTVSLGSVPPQLYSHGSAALGTSQQLAGAAGTALFVVVYTIAASLAAGSGSAETVPAIAAGVHAAFFVGAFLSLGAITLAWFIQRPLAVPGAGRAAAAH